MSRKTKKRRKTSLLYVLSFMLAIMAIFTVPPLASMAATAQTTIIALSSDHSTYQIGEKVTVTIRVSAPDGSYLTKAYCGFGYNSSTMKKLTDTDTEDHIWLTSDKPVKWLSGDIEFEMKADGKMFFIAGAYDGEGVIKAYRADGSRMSCPRASVVYKIGTGIYTPTSDCNLASCIITDANTGETINFNRDFDPNIVEYWAEVPVDTESISIDAKTELAEDTMLLPENVTLVAGENLIKVGVQSVGGGTKEYLFHITRPTETAEVSEIRIYDDKGNQISYPFAPEIHDYDINVDEDCRSIRFEADGTNGSAEYPDNLEIYPGYNSKIVTIKTATDQKEYEYYIYRKLSSLSMSSLVIDTSDGQSYPLTPDFSPETEKYELSVPSDVSKAYVHYTLANKDDYLKEEYNEVKLDHGNNVIDLVVTDGVNERTYEINIIREEATVFTQENDEGTPKLNDKEHVGFQYTDLVLIAGIGALIIAIVLIGSILFIRSEKKEYLDSNEAVSAQREKERKARLQKIEKEMKKEKKARKSKKG